MVGLSFGFMRHKQKANIDEPRPAIDTLEAFSNKRASLETRIDQLESRLNDAMNTIVAFTNEKMK